MGFSKQQQPAQAQTTKDQYMLSVPAGGGEAGMASSPLVLMASCLDLEAVLKAIQDSQVTVEHKVDELRIDLSLIRQYLRVLFQSAYPGAAWAAENQELTPATRGGEAARDKGPWQDSPPGACAEEALQVTTARAAAKGWCGSSHDHPAHNLQEEQVATPALFASAETIPTSQK
ncbi:hypothetical protein NDU88_004984 [Pleurodeles waltl]|uniref:Uncharacterized protein n=1 Tax=Pleurodeles waltl TaxID=8319 RepID=A0AAV7WBF1_PLEWA|nr:hypothetical protein NDU88_004984 [Pleurodeles waltl]